MRPPKEFDEAVTTMLLATTSCSEAKLLSCIGDENLTMRVKKQKLETALTGIARLSKDHNHDLKATLHPAIYEKAREIVLS